MTEPIFEIMTKDNHFKIYENGMYEGFPEGGMVINRIPVRIAESIAHFCEKTASWSPARKAVLSKSGGSQGIPE